MPLVSWWPLHEDSGSTAFDVRGSNDGTLNGGVTVNATGILGTSAYDFDGTDNYVGVADDASLDFADGDAVSLSLWVNLDTTGSSFRTFVSKTDANGEGYIIQKIDTDNIRFNLYDGSTTLRADSTATVSTGTWTFITGTFDGVDTANLYINGTVDATSAQSIGSLANSAALNIGRRVDTGGQYTDGRIADVRVYDHALSQSEIQYLYEVVRGQASLTTEWQTV